MENIYKNLETDDSYSIIGEKDQVLQIVLKKNDAIIFKKQNLYYMSSMDMEETLHKNKNHFFTSDKISQYGKRIQESSLVRLKNIKNSFEYVGIYGGGKIMKIIPFLYNDLFIRLDCLIAFSDGLDLIEVPEVKTKIERFHKPDHLFQKDHKYFMVYSHKAKEREHENFSLTDYPLLKESVYLSNENLLMEKRLGKNEEITIKTNSLLCFEKSVTFNRIEETSYKNINKSEYFTIQGPGLIILELNHQNTKKIQTMKNLRSIAVLTIILTFLLMTRYVFEDYKEGMENL